MPGAEIDQEPETPDSVEGPYEVRFYPILDDFCLVYDMFNLPLTFFLIF